MKKVFCIRDFAKSTEVKNLKAMIVAFKKNGELSLKNLCCDPSDRMKVNIDKDTDEVVFRFKVFDNEFLVLGEAEGLEPTKTITKGAPPQ